MICEQNKSLYIAKKMLSKNATQFFPLLNTNSKYLANICYIKNEGETATVFSEYVSGKSLSDLIRELNTFSEKFVVETALHICEGLSVLHQNGIIHRDITPNNIIISPDGVAKIIDFGIARKYSEKKREDTVVMGTPGYAAPEQFGFLQSDSRVDIYALGVLMNVLLCGEMPNHQITTSSLSRIINKCIQIDKNQRFSNVIELKEALISYKRKEMYQFTPQPPKQNYETPKAENNEQPKEEQPPIKPKKRHKFFSILGWILAGVFLALIINDALLERPNTGKMCISYTFMFVVPYICFHNFFELFEKITFVKKLPNSFKNAICKMLMLASIAFAIAVV